LGVKPNKHGGGIVLYNNTSQVQCQPVVHVKHNVMHKYQFLYFWDY